MCSDGPAPSPGILVLARSVSDLTYFQSPEYSKYIRYPHCLSYLELLQQASFRSVARPVAAAMGAGAWGIVARGVGGLHTARPTLEGR